jgi:hypothetical protein
MGKQLAVNGKLKPMNERASEHHDSENRIKKELGAAPRKENGDGEPGWKPPRERRKKGSGQNYRPKTQHWRSKKTWGGASLRKIGQRPDLGLKKNKQLEHTT